MDADAQPLKIYITHLCRADEEYNRVLEYLDGARRLRYELVSQPQPPRISSREGQREWWREQILLAEVIVALSTLFDVDAEALEFQVRFAKSAGKPVLLMRRFGSVLTPPVSILRQAEQAVDWNERAIADALRKFGRGESQARWDTIDFTLD